MLLLCIQKEEYPIAKFKKTKILYNCINRQLSIPGDEFLIQLPSTQS